MPLRTLVDALGSTIALRGPSLCAICRGWGESRVCRDCFDRFAPAVTRCVRCALPVPAGVDVCGSCLAASPPFDAALAALDYRAPWDRLVAAFKFTAWYPEREKAAAVK